MKKILAGMLFIASAVMYSGCTKEKTNTGTTPPETQAGDATTGKGETPSTMACSTKFLDLVIDPATGGSYVYVIYNTPSNPPVTVVNLNGSAGNNQIGSSSPLTSVTRMTGLSFDPATGNCYGITGAGGSHPHSLIKFHVSDPNVVSIAPLISLGGAINLSDIEYNAAMGRYYAINRAVAANNRLVFVDVTTGNVAPLPLSTGLPLRGLAVDPGGKIYLMRMTGASGNVYVADPINGNIILGPCAYGVVIAPGVLGANSEMGLHFDDVCTNLLVTGNAAGTAFQLTDALPACLGGPVPPSVPVPIKPTVDFAKLN